MSELVMNNTFKEELRSFKKISVFNLYENTGKVVQYLPRSWTGVDRQVGTSGYPTTFGQESSNPEHDTPFWDCCFIVIETSIGI